MPVDEVTGVAFEVVDSLEDKEDSSASNPASDVVEEVEDEEDVTDSSEGSDTDVKPEARKAEEEPSLSALEAKLKQEAEERIRKIQSAADKRNAQLENQLKQYQQRMDELERSMREEQIKDLPEEERAKLKQIWDIEDATKELDKLREELDAYYADSLKMRLVTLYSEYGVSEADLDGINDPDEWERFCLEKELQYWRNHKREPETKREVKKEERQERKPPAGVKARSDVGGGAPPPQGPTPVTGTGISAMREALSKTAWETLSSRQ